MDPTSTAATHQKNLLQSKNVTIMKQTPTVESMNSCAKPNQTNNEMGLHCSIKTNFLVIRN